MNKITSTDKFKQLKSKIAASKSDKAFKGPRIPEKTGQFSNNVNLTKKINHSVKETVRQSPRFQKGVKKFEFYKVQCSFKSNNTNAKEPITVSPPTSELINGTQKEVQQNVRTNQKDAQLVRDSSGFLVPSQPPPRTDDYHLMLLNQEINEFNCLISEMCNFNLFNEVEIAYHIANMTDSCCKEFHKAIKKNRWHIPLACAPSELVVERFPSWIPSIQNSVVSSSKQSNFKNNNHLNVIPTKSISSTNENVQNNTIQRDKSNTFLLRDWSVIKGKGKTELTLSGKLIDILSRKVVEPNHVSSFIIEKIANNIVKTIFCTYNLCGNFVGNDDIPTEIRKCFVGNIFPDNWKSLVSMWHNLDSQAAVNKSKSNKRSLEDVLKENYPKRIKSNFDKKSNPNIFNMSKSTTVFRKMDRTTFNDSMITRGAARKNQMMR